jgi:metallo-beta-lactamase family protein
LGANRQVTGSRYWLECDGSRVLVDCGMFQEREYLGRNWLPGPVEPKRIQSVLLTHAHLDHCGLLPRLVHEGFRGPIITTAATADLAELVLRDSAEIQREDVALKQKRHRKEGRKGAFPEIPLYTLDDVERTVKRFQTVSYGKPVAVADGVTAVLRDAGHILGSAMIEMTWQDGGEARRIVFSGDIGQWDRPIIRDPSLFTQADFVVMESTYGDRLHEDHGGIESQLQAVLAETLDRGGNTIIPIFAIERAQELMYYVSRMVRGGRLAEIEVFLDSPMAAGATQIFARHRECYDEEMQQLLAAGQEPLDFPGLKIIRTVEESKQLNHRKRPAVIMATSGMCTAGRIKHHLRHNITRPESTILFVGYQAQGTLGRQILEGHREVRIHGQSWPVRAKIAQIQGVSGHADRAGLLRWLNALEKPPRRLFLTHGEMEAAQGLAERIGAEKGWSACIPEYQQVVALE